MNEVRICIQGGGFWALAGAIAVSLPAAFTPAVTAQCDNPTPIICDGQIGIQGGFEQLCDAALETSDDISENPGDTNDGWTGLAYPFQTGGTMVDAVTFTLNGNRAGGDIWILENSTEVTNPPTCGQPDITKVLAVICCALEGLATDTGGANPVPIIHTVSFPPVMTSAIDPTWVVFVGRTGLAGQSVDGFFDGSVFPSHSVARDCNLDMADPPVCQTLSAPGQAFANLQGTGNPGDWTDLDTLGNPTLGTPYCVDLVLLGLGDDGTNCINNAAATALCCLPTPECVAEVPWKCGEQGGFNGGDNSICFFNPFGECSCGPGAGDCTDPAGNGTKGCELLQCCATVCLNDPACCSFEWDANCATSAAIATACILCQSAVNCQIGDGAGHAGILAITSDVHNEFAVAENFVPFEAGVITQTCWWGLYFDLFDLADGGVDDFVGDCSEAFGDNDSFTVTFYLNSPVGGLPGFPGAVHAGPFAISAANLENTATTRLIAGASEFIYTATHPPVSVNAGQCYWVEVRNDTTPAMGEADCLWFWDTAPPGDEYSAGGDATTGTPVYDPFLTFDFDLATCFGIALGEITECLSPLLAACDGNLNPCGLANATGGCDTSECCSQVCAVNPDCCDIAWDQSCVELAVDCALAFPCAGIDVSCATVVEAEVCGADINSGCDVDPLNPLFIDIVSGDIIHGTGWRNVGADHDHDNYRITTDAAADVNGDGLVRICLNVVGELPVIAHVFNDELGDCVLADISFDAFSQTCTADFGGETINDIALGTYSIEVTFPGDAGDVANKFACGNGVFGNNYMLSVEVLDNDGTECPNADAVSCVTACPWDCQPGAPSGVVDVPDLLALLAVWNIPGANPCDFTGDDIVNVPDLLQLLGNWGPCPQ